MAFSDRFTSIRWPALFSLESSESLEFHLGVDQDSRDIFFPLGSNTISNVQSSAIERRTDSCTLDYPSISHDSVVETRTNAFLCLTTYIKIEKCLNLFGKCRRNVFLRAILITKFIPFSAPIIYHSQQTRRPVFINMRIRSKQFMEP